MRRFAAWEWLLVSALLILAVTFFGAAFHLIDSTRGGEVAIARECNGFPIPAGVPCAPLAPDADELPASCLPTVVPGSADDDGFGPRPLATCLTD